MLERTENPHVWTKEGTPLDALKMMLKCATVSTRAFHQVLERLQSSEHGDNTELQEFFDQLLHIGGDYDMALMRGNRISTVTVPERNEAESCVNVVPENAVYDLACSYWVANNIPLEERLPTLFAKKNLPDSPDTSS